DDECIVVPPALFQVSEELAQRRISIGNLAVIEPVLIYVGVWRRWLVRIVRVVQMHPGEMRSGGVSIEPGFRVLLHFHSATFEAAPPGLAGRLLRKIVVELESAIE